MAESFVSTGPFIETDFFRGAPNSVKFGVAMSRHADEPGRSGLLMPVEDEAAIHLVQQSYRLAGIIGDSEGEMADLRALDGSSERFVVMERLGKTSANLFATAKLVHKRDKWGYLPIEKYIPDIFDELDPVGCVEMSQLTSSSLNREMRGYGFLAILRAAYGYALSLSPAYLATGFEDSNVASHENGQGDFFGDISTIIGVTEDFVVRRARDDFGINTKKLRDEPIFVQESREECTELYAVAFDLEEVREVHQAGTNEVFNLYLEGIESHLGMGWFGDGIIQNLDYPGPLYPEF